MIHPLNPQAFHSSPIRIQIITSQPQFQNFVTLLALRKCGASSFLPRPRSVYPWLLKFLFWINSPDLNLRNPISFFFNLWLYEDEFPIKTFLQQLSV